MTGTHQALSFSDIMNFIGIDIRTIERHADVLINACTDIGLAVNVRKTYYMEVGRHRGMTLNEHITVDSNSYEKVKTFKYSASFFNKSKFFR